MNPGQKVSILPLYKLPTMQKQLVSANAI